MRRLYALIKIGGMTLSGTAKVTFTSCTPKSSKWEEIEFTMSEYDLARLARQIRDALRELQQSRMRQNEFNLQDFK